MTKDFNFNEDPYLYLDQLCNRKTADIPRLCIDGDVVLSRYEGEDPRLTDTPVTNVPHLLTKHSPTGFEWGYSGSGPADLALNIMICFVGLEKAIENQRYLQFREEFITSVPREGGTISRRDIMAWLEKQNIDILLPAGFSDMDVDGPGLD